ncbi:hypothetical protein D3273_21545 [Lichenibacterium minor]|uniref:Uncharacterized protein n=1 Tax=Lichenibacterium minor TaxID=2316528 RepID=A0A4Q2U0C8_9HYPH|nr:hypothetical protein [Lichenibacterium minor]RYC29869.1 hypothetical protein D3273_21545 [Lichenibacterium minor]
MPLNPRPMPHPDHSQTGHDHARSGFREWSSQVGGQAPFTRQTRAAQPIVLGIDLTHPLAKVAVVAFVGYTFGRLLHRRSRKAAPSVAPRQQPYRPGATEPYRVQPIRERSDIRFR